VRLDLVAGDHRWRHFDQRHNVKFVTDAAGDVVAHHLYAGYRRVASFGPDEDVRGFAGGTHAAGLVVLGARVLDPEAGRFLSPDPVEQLLDAHAYAWGNPIQLWDPSGFQAEAMPDGPPAVATVFQVLGNVFAGVAAALAVVPAPPAKLAAGVFALLAATARSVSIAIRDGHARSRGGLDAGGGGPAEFPLPPAAGFETRTICIDGYCFEVPRNGPPRPPGPVPGGGGGRGGSSGFSFDTSAAGCAGTSVCGLGPELAFLLPWLLRWRRRRSAEGRLRILPGRARRARA
jgi:RHS repeat-associated protein